MSDHGLIEILICTTTYPKKISNTELQGRYSESGIKIRFYDYLNNNVLADYHMETNSATKGFKVKGIHIIDENHFIACISNFKIGQIESHQCQDHDHLTPEQLKFDPRFQPKQMKKNRYQSRIVLMKMDFTPDDIVTEKRGPADSYEFTVLDTYDFYGAPVTVDGIAFDDGVALVADQYNDRVVIFSVDITAKNALTFISEKTGYLMPHGLTMSKALDLVAVTCYGDNSIHIQPLSVFLNDTNIPNSWLLVK